VIRRVLQKAFGRSPKPWTRSIKELSGYSIGEWTYGRPSILDWKDGTQLQIGRFCSIARDVMILVGGEHHLDWVSTYPFHELWPDQQSNSENSSTRSKGNVIIENDVWIGARCTILSGVTIANGAVVGAGSVVTKSVPAYGIVAGNPARLIRFRFDEDIIRRLQAIRWWEWPEAEVRSAIPLLCSGKISEFLKTYENGKS
jgi:acetyltransferase-like isoleucine patch superfamily enzyme